MDLARIVIDTNIVYSAQHSKRGASALLMSLVGKGLFEAHVSAALAFEYQDVLSRYCDSLGLSDSDVVDFVAYFCSVAVRHEEIFYRWRPELPDAGDEFILDLAVVARCDFIVTHNLKDFRGSEKFGIKAINPKSFLEQIGVI